MITPDFVIGFLCGVVLMYLVGQLLQLRRKEAAKTEAAAAAAVPAAAGSPPVKPAGVFKTYFWTAAWIAIALLLTAGQLGMMVIVYATIGLVLWTIYNLVKMGGQPQRRRPFAIKLGCWLVTLAIVFSYQSMMSAAAQRRADQVAALIATYKTAHGTYPPNLEALGAANQALIRGARVRYGFYEDKPYLFYPSSTQPFTTVDYDFASQQWQERGD